MRSYDKFASEILDIRRWFFTTLFAYKTTSQIYMERIRNKESVTNHINVAFNESGCNELSFIHRLTTDNVKKCKELALIRSISALEVFLVDSVKDVFCANKKPFLLNDVIEYHLGEVLSCPDISKLHSKYIEQKCRNLHSSGFEEIAKYYKRIFEIEFSKFSTRIDGNDYGIEYLQQYHQVRHLVIHRLGSTDEQYRKKYNSMHAFIKIENDELVKFLNVIILFARYLDERLDEFVQTPPPENRIVIEVEIIDNNSFELFEPTFKIPYKKTMWLPLSSILETKEFLSESLLRIQLHGAFIHLRKYYKILLKTASSGKIKVLSYSTISLMQTKKRIRQFQWDDVEKVIELLPEKPWEKNIHKKIAEQLGWSNNKVNGIIDSIEAEKAIPIKSVPRRLSLKVGETFAFQLDSYPPESIPSIKWKSSEPEVATINNGEISALSIGCAEISARVYGYARRLTCSVTVLGEDSAVLVQKTSSDKL